MKPSDSEAEPGERAAASASRRSRRQITHRMCRRLRRLDRSFHQTPGSASLSLAFTRGYRLSPLRGCTLFFEEYCD